MCDKEKTAFKKDNNDIVDVKFKDIISLLSPLTEILSQGKTFY